MTAEEVLALCAGQTMIRNKGEVFFNTRDHDLALAFQASGARLVPYDAMQFSTRNGKQPTPAWEVHVWMLCVREFENIYGERERDMSEVERLLSILRARDGYALPHIHA